MKGDFSRFSFEPKRNVRTVTVQQGRVLTDADMNEASEATLRRIEVETRDTFGPVAASLGSDGFKIVPPGGGQPARLSAGRLYVDGLLLENHVEQNLPAIAGSGRRLIAVAGVVDHVTGVDDPILRDAALGDADTAGRAVVRTETLVLDAAANDGCGAPNAAFSALSAASGGRMTISLTPSLVSSDPCKLSPDSGYARLENLLYRLEVQDGRLLGTTQGRYGLDALKLKFSRNNACEIARITSVNGTEILLEAASKDGLSVFRAGEHVEFLPAATPYDVGASGAMALITGVNDNILTVDNATGAASGGRLRLWSQSLITLGADKKVSVDGLDFTFSGTNFRQGDYWVAPGRYALHDLDPTVPKAVPLPPLGPRLVFAKLGLLTVNAGVIDPASITDCRPLFVPMTQSVELDYAGGDGQSICPPTGPAAAPLTDALPARLRAVTRIGHQPVAGARVIFAIALPNPAAGVLAGQGPAGPVSGSQITVASDANGMAEATWTLSSNPANPVQRVTATLQTDANPGQLPPPPLHYTAELDLAARTAYQPGCATLNTQTTVQGALDKLCNVFENLTASQVKYVPGECSGLNGITNVQAALTKLCNDILNLGKTDCIVATDVTLRLSKRKLDNNEGVKPQELVEGFTVSFDDKISINPNDGFEPIARLVVDMPFPSGASALMDWRKNVPAANGSQAFSFGTSPLYLSGQISVAENTLTWTPTKTSQDFLAKAGTHSFGLNWRSEPTVIFEEPYIKGWITLRGDSIWAGEGDKRRYLNGDMLRFPTDRNPFSIFPDFAIDPSKRIDMIRQQLNPQRAGNFELWFKMAV